MARNSERAMAVLNRWTSLKTNIVKGVKKKTIKETITEENIADCEEWRNQIIRDLTRKISEIQNASLGEELIRELNDEINNLLSEKSKWEDKIAALGGINYKDSAPKIMDAYGAPFGTEGSYKYFGASKYLPGVRDLFDEQNQETKKTRRQLYKNINPDYYGWRDEDDPNLLIQEKLYELQSVQF